MATCPTCPQCGGYLSDDHRCVGAWWRITRTMVVALVGAPFGVIAASVLAEQPSQSLLAVAGLLGAVLGAALARPNGFK
jgi:hypothetical protein